MSTRKSIDADFARMNDDADYKKETQTIAEDFAESDWESFGAGVHAGEERLILFNDNTSHKSILKTNTEN